MTDKAVLPNDDGLMGTSRHPRTTSPSSAAIFATSFFTSAPFATNAIPVAYASAAGILKSTTS